MPAVKYNWVSGQRFGLLILTGKSCIINRNREVEYICDCGGSSTTVSKRINSGWQMDEVFSPEKHFR